MAVGVNNLGGIDRRQVGSTRWWSQLLRGGTLGRGPGAPVCVGRGPTPGGSGLVCCCTCCCCCCRRACLSACCWAWRLAICEAMYWRATRGQRERPRAGNERPDLLL